MVVKKWKEYKNDVGMIVVFKGINEHGEYEYTKYWPTDNKTRPKKEKYRCSFKNMEQFVRITKIKH